MIHRRLPASLKNRIGGDDVRPPFPPGCGVRQPAAGARSSERATGWRRLTSCPRQVWCGVVRHVRWLHRRIEGHGRATPKADLYFSHGNPTSMHGDPASTHGNPVSMRANLTYLQTSELIFTHPMQPNGPPHSTPCNLTPCALTNTRRMGTDAGTYISKLASLLLHGDVSC